MPFYRLSCKVRIVKAPFDHAERVTLVRLIGSSRRVTYSFFYVYYPITVRYTGEGLRDRLHCSVIRKANGEIF